MKRFTASGGWKWRAESSIRPRQAKRGASWIATAGRVKHYVQLINGGLVGVSTDGRFLWAYEKLGPNTANIPTPVVIGDHVFGSAGYVVVRSSDAEVRREIDRIVDVRQSAKGYSNYQEWIGNTQLEQRVSLEDYSVSNRGLRSGLVGTPEQVADRIRAFEEAGVDLLLLQFSPQYEEMERFAEEVLPFFRRSRDFQVQDGYPDMTVL